MSSDTWHPLWCDKTETDDIHLSPRHIITDNGRETVVRLRRKRTEGGANVLLVHGGIESVLSIPEAWMLRDALAACIKTNGMS